MSQKWLAWALPATLLAAFLALATVLPRHEAAIYLSPDETAVAVSAVQFASTGAMRVHDDLLTQVPWLRPRSFVTQGANIVPVGFLGMSLLAGLLLKVLGGWSLGWLTPLLALSALYPLWHLARGLRNGPRAAVLLVWASFPTIILYANRGLFPNLPVVCLMLWAAWLLNEGRRGRPLVIAALLTGLALALRPTELPWVLVWCITAVALRTKTEHKVMKVRDWPLLVFAFSLFPVVAAYLAWQTYGSPWAIGYWLHDSGAAVPGTVEAAGLTWWWPFGFHPRNVLFNLRGYLLEYLAPWTAVAALGALLTIRRSRPSRILALAGLCTLGLLVLVYGQSVYQDHVGLNVVSLGNSFLRYILPFVPFIALAVGWTCDQLFVLRPTRLTLAVLFMGVWVLTSFGVWSATARDKEGLVQDVQELERYGDIRRIARQIVPADSAVLSDRSDKIFFPVFRAASPMPSRDRIKDLIATGEAHVYYFGTAVSFTELAVWKGDGFMLAPVFRSDGQVLYDVTTSSTEASAP